MTLYHLLCPLGGVCRHLFPLAFKVSSSDLCLDFSLPCSGSLPTSKSTSCWTVLSPALHSGEAHKLPADPDSFHKLRLRYQTFTKCLISLSQQTSCSIWTWALHSFALFQELHPQTLRYQDRQDTNLAFVTTTTPLLLSPALCFTSLTSNHPCPLRIPL